MSDKVKSRKRTRSVKGQALDEMKAANDKAKSKSPKTKQLKIAVTTNKEKPKASRRIVFGDEQPESSCIQVNNNSNVKGPAKVARGSKISNTSTRNSNKEHQVMDPCFKNILRGELLAEKKQQKLKNMSSKIDKFENITETNCVLQNEKQTKRNKDGINIDVEGIEELDYVDDYVDDELSDYEVEQIEHSASNMENNQKHSEVDKPLPGATAAHDDEGAV